MSLKKTIKKGERKFFDMLKFDTLGYPYKRPNGEDPNELRRILVAGYFKNQPGAISVSIISCYLFIKKALLFILRRFKRMVK